MMSNEKPKEASRLYVDPQDVRLQKVREWLLVNGLSAALQFADPAYYFDVTLPPNWPSERRRQFADDLAAFRAEFA